MSLHRQSKNNVTVFKFMKVKCLLILIRYGSALKHFRAVFECRLCIISTSVNDLFGFLLGRCGDCCLMIAQNWNKAEQYTNELKIDELYDSEIREVLQSECKACIQEGNII